MRLTRPAGWVLFVLFLCGHQVVAETIFTDTAPATGTDTTSYGRGSVMVDFDGDGLLDLVAANDYMILPAASGSHLVVARRVSKTTGFPRC